LEVVDGIRLGGEGRGDYGRRIRHLIQLMAGGGGRRRREEGGGGEKTYLPRSQ